MRLHLRESAHLFNSFAFDPYAGILDVVAFVDVEQLSGLHQYGLRDLGRRF